MVNVVEIVRYCDCKIPIGTVTYSDSTTRLLLPSLAAYSLVCAIQDSAVDQLSDNRFTITTGSAVPRESLNASRYSSISINF